MLRKRVIPCLLMDGGRLIKTYKFQKPKYVGDPINAIRIFNDKEVDELILIDINASKNKTEPDFKLLEKISSECFMPLCYGGGINNIDQAKALFNIGIEKICIQTEFIRNPSFVKELSAQFGSQSIVVSVDIKKDFFRNYKVYSSVDRKLLKIPLIEHLKQIELLGAGEILMSSVDNEGTMSGMDTNLIKIGKKASSLPIIANTGVGSLDHIKEGFEAGAHAIAVGSFFVFHGPHKAVLITYPNPNEFNNEIYER